MDRDSTGAAPQSRTTLAKFEHDKAAKGNDVVRDQSHGRKSVVRGLPLPLAGEKIELKESLPKLVLGLSAIELHNR